jgi:hypothetical protein
MKRRHPKRPSSLSNAEKCNFKPWQTVYVDTSGKWRSKSSRSNHYHTVFICARSGFKLTFPHKKRSHFPLVYMKFVAQRQGYVLHRYSIGIVSVLYRYFVDILSLLVPFCQCMYLIGIWSVFDRSCFGMLWVLVSTDVFDGVFVGIWSVSDRSCIGIGIFSAFHRHFIGVLSVFYRCLSC